MQGRNESFFLKHDQRPVPNFHWRSYSTSWRYPNPVTVFAQVAHAVQLGTI